MADLENKWFLLSERLFLRITELEVETARLKDEAAIADHLFTTGQAKEVMLAKGLNDAKAEIARLTKKCVFLGDANMELLDRSKAADIRAEKAKAEIARLREALLEVRGEEDTEHAAIIDAALKTDTGEKP